MAISLEKLKEFDVNAFFEDLQTVDFKAIGTAAPAIRGFLIALLFIAIIAGSYFFLIKPKLEDYERAQKEEVSLKKTFEAEQKKAANLDAYKDQLERMEGEFGSMLRQLPERTDVENLVVDLSQTGARNSLKVELLKPETEIAKEFYAELPVKLKVFGKFHELARFASDVAALPRIVTLHDIKISIVDAEKPTELSMELVAKTYRYLE